jgi:hypothetical protein
MLFVVRIARTWMTGDLFLAQFELDGRQSLGIDWDGSAAAMLVEIAKLMSTAHPFHLLATYEGEGMQSDLTDLLRMEAILPSH